MNQLLQYALFYKDYGFNVFNITNKRNCFNFSDSNLLKSPAIDISALTSSTQKKSELQNIKWDNSVGIGAVLGFNNLVSIDIDGVVSPDFLNFLLRELNLPEEYEWIIHTGSKAGFQILFYCPQLPEEIKDKEIIYEASIGNTEYRYMYGTIPYFPSGHENSFYPQDWCKNKFMKIEFKWGGNIVLPPSIHQSGFRYSFFNDSPKNNLLSIPFSNILSLKNKIAGNVSTCSEYFDDTWEQEDREGDIHYFESTIPTQVFEQNYLPKDEKTEYQFTERKLESCFLFTMKKLKINSNNHAEENICCHYQISYLILNKFDNVVKRNTFNYLSESNSNNWDGEISCEDSANILLDREFVIYKILNEISHCNHILTNTEMIIELFRNELINQNFHSSYFPATDIIIKGPDLDMNDSIFKSVTEIYFHFINNK